MSERNDKSRFAPGSPAPGASPPLPGSAIRAWTASSSTAHVDPFDPLAAAAFPGASRQMASIRYVSADGASHVHSLGARTAVGRHSDNDIQLLDLEVSKAHLEIVEEAQGYALRDLSSANGTRVNGTPVEHAQLADGDLIEVGTTQLRFSVETLVPAPRAIPLWARASLAREGRGEQTMVTLIPDAFEPLDGTNVFAVPMSDEFSAAESIDDEQMLRRDYERLRVAFDLARAVGVETDLCALGQTLLDRILDVLPADLAVIMSLEESGELFTLASQSREPGTEVRIPRAIIEQVVHRKDALLTSDALLDAALRSSHTVVGQQIRSALCVPLLVGLDVFGAIYLSTSSAAGAYEERDLALLRAIATPAALAVANARLVARAERDASTRAQLSRFLSPALVERVVQRDLSLETAGDKVKCSVLFADIRGFTALTEGAAPEDVVSMLNEYFEAMVERIFDHGGILDKFLGDGLMAVWGTPVASADDPIAAMRAANAMRHVLECDVNVARRRRGAAPLAAGYGIATGFVVAGAMGATRRQDFTVIGDTVNLASRLCSAASPGQILVCANTQANAAERGISLQSLPPRSVKGFARPVPVYELSRGAL